MLTEVPRQNNNQFLSVEDTYVMNPHGGFTESVDPMEVIISCPHKRKRVSALMSESIKISANAKWKPIFQQSSLMSGGTLGNDINNVLSWSLGISVHQPWMNKKQYESTEPFSVTIPLTFVSTMGDPKAEVYDPCMALLSFVYPRQVGLNELRGDNITQTTGGESGLAASFSDAATLAAQNIGNVSDCALISGAMKKSEEVMQNTNGLIGATLSAYEIFSVPGSSLTGKKGDTVSISIGPIFNLGKVYLEKVDIDFSKTLNPLGYPLAAKVTLTATPVEACYCEPNGNLVIFDQFTENSQAMNNMLSAAANTGAALTEMVVTFAKNAWGIVKDTGKAISEGVSGGKS